jgi:hypothetical protein
VFCDLGGASLKPFWPRLILDTSTGGGEKEGHSTTNKRTVLRKCYRYIGEERSEEYNNNNNKDGFHNIINGKLLLFSSD